AVQVLSPRLYRPVDWDETIYHLVYTRAFAATGSLPYLMEARIPVFPLFSEVLSAAVLLAADDVATHWLAILATFGTAMLLLSWPGVSRQTKLLAAAVFLGSPH